jgi:hypothetical protein
VTLSLYAFLMDVYSIRKLKSIIYCQLQLSNHDKITIINQLTRCV